MRFIRRTALTALMLMLSATLWAANATFTFNTASGSDTAASGAGPAIAKSGTAAATAASTVVTLLVDNPDLSGVATDGSAWIWIGSSSGRQFAKIIGYDNCTGVKTVTVANAFANTESGKNWGIGGKRGSINSTSNRLLFTADGLAGIDISLDDNQTLTGSAIAIGVTGDIVSGPITIHSTSSRVTINTTANAACFTNASSNFWIFRNLKFTCSNGTKTSSYSCTSQGVFTEFENCIFGDATNTIIGGISRAGSQPSIKVINCYFISCTGTAIESGSSTMNMTVLGCFFSGGGAVCIDAGSGSSINIFINNIIYNTTGDAIFVPSISNTTTLIMIGNTIHACTGDGLDTSSGVFNNTALICYNNNFTANGNYGIRAASGQSSGQGFIDYNNYGTGGTANTSGDHLNITAGAHDKAKDPLYVNASGGNFAMQEPSLRAAGFPMASVGTIGAGQSSTYSYPDIGAAQSAGSDSGAVY